MKLIGGEIKGCPYPSIFTNVMNGIINQNKTMLFLTFLMTSVLMRVSRKILESEKKLKKNMERPKARAISWVRTPLFIKLAISPKGFIPPIMR